MAIKAGDNYDYKGPQSNFVRDKFERTTESFQEYINNKDLFPTLDILPDDIIKNMHELAQPKDYDDHHIIQVDVCNPISYDSKGPNYVQLILIKTGKKEGRWEPYVKNKLADVPSTSRPVSEKLLKDLDSKTTTSETIEFDSIEFNTITKPEGGKKVELASDVLRYQDPHGELPDPIPERVNDVLLKKEQGLNPTEKQQVFDNLGLSERIKDNLNTDNPKEFLSARQGLILDQKKVDKNSIVNNIIEGGADKVLSAEQGKALGGALATTNKELDTLQGVVTDNNNDLQYKTRELKNVTDGLISKTSNVQPQDLSDATIQFIKTQGGNNNTIVNNPDNEDLSIKKSDVGEVLQLSDKEYNAASFSGLGRVYLRKNEDSIKAGQGNMLKPEWFRKTNTRYIIQYDYDLNGAGSDGKPPIVIPENCILDFQGGSFKNGRLHSAGDCLLAGNLKSVLDKVYLTGIWKNPNLDFSVWNVSTAKNYDNSTQLEYALDSYIPLVINGRYGLSKPVYLNETNITGGRIYSGFVANDDFHSIDVHFPKWSIYEEQDATVKGMFYYRDQSPILKYLWIDGNYKAEYCFEHVYAYGCPQFEICDITKAKDVGILQYFFEKPIWNNVTISYCNIAVYISTNKYNPLNPFDFNGKHMGMPNIGTFNNLRCLENNYGIIIHGGSNYILNSPETAHNAIFGLFLSGSTYEMVNYYTEGDCYCDKYRNPDGTIIGLDDYKTTCQYLIDNNLDGYDTVKNDITYGQRIYYRAPVVVHKSNVHITSAFMSVKQRSNEIMNVKKVSLPTIRKDAGVDTLFVIVEGSLICDNINPYYYRDDVSSTRLEYAVIQIPENISNLLSRVDMNIEDVFYHKYKAKISTLNEYDSSAGIFRVGSTNVYGIGFMNIINSYKDEFMDFNQDIETARYGYSPAIDYRQFILQDFYKDVPLFKKESTNPEISGRHNVLYFTKEQILEKFNNLEQIKAVFYAKSLNNIDDYRIRFTITYKKNNEYVYSDNLDQQAVRKYPLGVYRYEKIINLTLGGIDWDKIEISFTLIGGYDKALLSDIFFYEVTDYIMKPYQYKSLYLESGTKSQRPENPPIGTKYFDNSVGKPIYYKGEKVWVDGNGTIVQ